MLLLGKLDLGRRTLLGTELLEVTLKLVELPLEVILLLQHLSRAMRTSLRLVVLSAE